MSHINIVGVVTCSYNSTRRLVTCIIGSSGNTLACCAIRPRFESRCGQKFVFSRKSPRYAALGTGCTLTAVPRLTQPSTLRGTVNEYQPYGWVIIPMVIGECSAYSSLYRRTQRSSLQLGLRVGGHLALTDFGPDEPQWTLAYVWVGSSSLINDAKM